MIHYADVSNHDRARRGSALDFRAAFSTGGLAPVVVAKLTESDNYIDPWGVETCKGARAAGAVVVGGYHVLARGGIHEQVAAFTQALHAAGANAAMVDVEPFGELVDAGRSPRWVDVLEFQSAWARLGAGKGWPPLCWYIPRWFWSGGLGAPSMRDLAGPLVSSNYISGGRTAVPATGGGWVPYGGKTPTIWQWTASANVAGLSADTDLNAFNGSAAELAALLTGGDDMLTDPEWEALQIGAYRTAALVRGAAQVTYGTNSRTGKPFRAPEPNVLAAEVEALKTVVGQLSLQLDAAVTVLHELAARPSVTGSVTLAASGEVTLTPTDGPG